MKPVTVAIVSAGGAGRAHFQRFRSSPDVNVKTIFDINRNKMLDLSKNYETNITSDYGQIIDDKDIDVVSICSPDSTHFDYAIDAIAARKHVLVEKPLATSLQQCEKLQAATRDPNYDKVFGVHHQMRYVPCFKSAREFVHNHDLGLPLVIEADYVHDMRERATQFDDWRINKESVQRVILGASSHTIDLMRWILNAEVTEVFSYASNIGWPDYPDVDTVMTLLKFDNGVIGKAMSTFACQRSQLNTLNIYGTKASFHNGLAIDKFGAKSFICPKKSLIKLPLLKWVLTQSPISLGPIENYPYSVYEHELACRKLVQEFLYCVRGGATFPVDFSEGAYTTQICLAGLESYEKGRPIEVNRAF